VTATIAATPLLAATGAGEAAAPLRTAIHVHTRFSTGEKRPPADVSSRGSR
jgi:hypothetical protein